MLASEVSVGVTHRALGEMLGLCRGLILEGECTARQATDLARWVAMHRDVSRIWPIDVVAARLARALSDGIVEREERLDLLAVLEQTLTGSDIRDNALLTALPLDDPLPPISVPNHAFCFVGRFYFGTRDRCEEAVAQNGGVVHRDLEPDTDYLVLGLLGNRNVLGPAYARTTERALEYRRTSRLAIVSEVQWAEAVGG